MKKTEVIYPIDALLLILFVGIGCVWFFGRNFPLEADVRHHTATKMVVCDACHGSGSGNCSVCGGFGTVEKTVICPVCKGKGNHAWQLQHGPETPCQRCRGSGKIQKRTTCTACNGTGKFPCKICGGTGQVHTTTTNTAYAVVMGRSLWEKCIGLIKIAPEANPCPQKEENGTYPIVTKYLETRFTKRPFRVLSWGIFQRDGEAWKMTATLECLDKSGSMISKKVEFIVRNRSLSNGRIVGPGP